MKRKCGNCKWHDDFTDACCNGASPFCADFTDEDYFCAEHEWKKGYGKEQQAAKADKRDRTAYALTLAPLCQPKTSQTL